MTRLGIVLCLTAALLAGCSYVAPGDAYVIRQHKGNIIAINAKVQVDPNLPAYVKTWWAGDTKTWIALEAWSRGAKLDANGGAQ